MKPINKRENVLPDLLKLCSNLDRIPLTKEIIQENVVGCSKTLKIICQEDGYDGYKDFCRQHGYGHKSDVYINGEYRGLGDLVLDDYITLWNDFKQKYGRFPTKEDCSYRKKYGYNLPPQQRFNDILKSNNLTLNEFKDLIGDSNKKVLLAEYDNYVKEYKRVSIEKGSYLTHKELLSNPYGMPGSRWFVKHCPNKAVQNFNHFVEWCGFIPTYEVSKELATSLILEKSKQLNRPLIQDDFSNPSSDEIGAGTIMKIWGTFNNMKRDLGLEIVQESLFKGITFDKVKSDLTNICNATYKKDERTVINTFDVAKYGEYSYSTHHKYFKDNNQLMGDFLESIGFSFQQGGCGISTTFNDGEVTLSQFETMFSKYLRDILGLRYNVDYFRDIRYSDFISDYEGFMDCDYIIHIKNQIMYVEIAGILRDYKDWYYKDRKILSSKSKERYRNSLKEKESMLKDNNLEYYIVFPQDCNEGFFNSIFKHREGEINGKINSI